MKIRWDVLGAEAPGGFKGTGRRAYFRAARRLSTPREAEIRPPGARAPGPSLFS